MGTVSHSQASRGSCGKQKGQKEILTRKRKKVKAREKSQNNQSGGGVRELKGDR